MLAGCYLAYPIDQAGNTRMDDIYPLIDWFKGRLIGDRLVSWVFDPGDAFMVTQGITLDRGLPTINRAALNNADLVVAFLPAGVPSIGVPMEIDRARAQGKHVLVISDADTWMLEMPGLARVGGFIQSLIEDAFEWIDSLDIPQQTPMLEDLRVQVHDGGQLPVRAYEDDAGLDLVVSQDTTIAPGTFADVPCGVSVQLPHWSWGLVTGRSSALRKRGLLVHSGVIDAGYRGLLFAGAWNMTDEVVTVKAGERVAQLIVMNNSTRRVAPIQVEQLSGSPRGTNGFGSTGN